MRILVDQSGYDLLNIGDVAMLEGCVERLRQLWPAAEIMVIAHVPDRLACYCPGTIPIGRNFADRPFAQLLPRKLRLGSEQAWKIAEPYLAGRFALGRIPRGQPSTAIAAVYAADVVVASGGGYVTDTWRWHGAGVLSLLSLAQRLGKPTAMFGQGLGPIRQRALLAQARSVLPRLAVLGLREGALGPDLALSLGTPASTIAVTGDDALELIAGMTGAFPTVSPPGRALGVNVRVAGYAGMDPAAAAELGAVLLSAAREFAAPIVALPVSRYSAESDREAIAAMLGRGQARTGITLADLTTPKALTQAVAECRAIVTGSYHAAVFALAQGIPAVCLARSSYYDAKFAGLAALFPSCSRTVSLGQPGFAKELRDALSQAWQASPAARAASRAAAARLVATGRGAYQQLHAVVGQAA